MKVEGSRKSCGGVLAETKSYACLSIAIMALFCWSAVAGAQDSTHAPAGTRSLAPTPFQLTIPPGHLLGNWHGLRTWLEDHGITPALTFVTDALGNATGGLRQGFTAANDLALDALFDLEKLHGPEDGSFHVSASARFGSSLSAKDIGNIFPVQQAFGGETLWLVNAAYKQELLDDRLEFRLGRIAAGDDFLVSPYYCAFVQGGMCGNPQGIFFNSPGMTAYPNATWGILVKVRPTERTYVMAGLYNGDPSIRANSRHGVDFSMNGPLFAIGEIAYRVNGLPGDKGLIGNYKAGVWYDNSRFTDFNTAGLGRSPSLKRGNWGFYGLFDQVLIRFGGQGSNRGFGVTGSVLISPDQSVSQMPYFFNAGLVARGIFPSRPTDVVGFGAVFGQFSSDLQDSQHRAEQPVQRHETVLELTYRLNLLSGALFFQPDLQYIIRPGGTGRISDAVVCGVQAGVNF
ncbi:MAG: carbohydrate porin [Chloroflexota bacterium]